MGAKVYVGLVISETVVCGVEPDGTTLTIEEAGIGAMLVCGIGDIDGNGLGEEISVALHDESTSIEIGNNINF